uniref:Transferrin receptor protein 1 n=1 Tax=Strix occidentalis caurina TaxID=311401 RepID=A0A8D0F346_STROC
MIGYLSYRGRMQKDSRCLDGSGKCEMTPTASYLVDDNEAEEEVPGPPVFYWPDLRNLLSDKLSTTHLENTSKYSFEAGQSEDESLAIYIHEQFESFSLDEVWNDEHYIKLQVKGSSDNTVSILKDGKEEELERPSAYVAYSKSGSVSGKPIHMNYGLKADFQKIKNLDISLNETIIIFKAGKIPLAEKVSNENCWAPLRLEDSSYFSQAHLGTGDPFTPGFPSFNHTQFPPVESSGLPRIAVQTISSQALVKLFRQPRHLFVGQEQPCTKTGGQKWPSSPQHLARTPCQNQSCLVRVVQLAQTFHSRACSFSPGMSKPVGNYSILVFCSVPLGLDNAAFPVLTYSGIPVVSFGFCNKDEEYPFLGTTQDTLDNLKKIDKLYALMRAAAEVAGQIALRLTHDHELFLDFERYDEELLAFQEKILPYYSDVKELGLTLNWLFFARGDFQRATDSLRNDISNSDRENRIIRRALNDRIMKVEYDFLSPYISPKDAPFRHIFFGKGSHTLQSLLENLQLLRTSRDSVDVNMLKEQLALATWTIKGAASALVGDIWNTDNEF